MPGAQGVRAGASLVGHVVNGHEVMRVLGEGGMGEVYIARHQQLGTVRALKVIHDDVKSNPSIAKRFKREAMVLGRLSITPPSSMSPVSRPVKRKVADADHARSRRHACCQVTQVRRLLPPQLDDPGWFDLAAALADPDPALRAIAIALVPRPTPAAARAALAATVKSELDPTATGAQDTELESMLQACAGEFGKLHAE